MNRFENTTAPTTLNLTASGNLSSPRYVRLLLPDGTVVALAYDSMTPKSFHIYSHELALRYAEQLLSVISTAFQCAEQCAATPDSPTPDPSAHLPMIVQNALASMFENRKQNVSADETPHVLVCEVFQSAYVIAQAFLLA